MNITEVRKSSKEVAHYLLSSKSEDEICAKVLETLDSGGRPVIVVGQYHNSPRVEECIRLVKTFQSALEHQSERPSALFPEGIMNQESSQECESRFQIPFRHIETLLVNTVDGHALDMRFFTNYRLAFHAVRGNIPLESYVTFSQKRLNSNWTEVQKREYLTKVEKQNATNLRKIVDRWLSRGFLPHFPADSIRKSIEDGLEDPSLTFPEAFLDFSSKFLRCLIDFDMHDVAGVIKAREAIGIQTEAESLKKWPLVKTYSLAKWQNALRTSDPVKHFYINSCVVEATHWTRELKMAQAVKDDPCLVPVVQVGAYHADNYLPEFLSLFGFTPFRLLIGDNQDNHRYNIIET